MRTITHYECEVCGAEFQTPAYALACEAHRPEPPAEFKAGAQIWVKTRSGHVPTLGRSLHLCGYMSHPTDENLSGPPPADHEWHAWFVVTDPIVYYKDSDHYEPEEDVRAIPARHISFTDPKEVAS